MVALLLETALLLTLAYFLGAFFGCMIRKMVAADAAPGREAAAVAAPGAVVAGGAALAERQADRFGKALTGEAFASERMATEAAPLTPAPIEAVAPRIEQITPELRERSAPAPLPGRDDSQPDRVAAAKIEVDTRSEMAPTTRSAPGVADDPPPEVTPSVASRHTTAWSPIVAGSAVAATGVAAALARSAEARPGLRGPQDLRDIRQIDDELARRLGEAGVTQFAQIADWTSDDVARVDSDLALDGRISRENWIEQARILASGGTTAYAARRALGVGSITGPSRDTGEPRPIEVFVPDDGSADVPPSSVPDAVDATAASGRLSDAARGRNFVDDDRLPVAAGSDGASSVAAQIARIAPATQPAIAPRAADRPPLDRSALAAAAAAAVVGTAAAAVGRRATDGGAGGLEQSDRAGELMRIDGVNAEVATLLRTRGVTRLSQVADWTDADAARFEGLLGNPGRISREDWIGQARRMTGAIAVPSGLGSQAGPSAAIEAARVASTRVSALRSVRSPALIGDRDVPVARDDLKRIRGVGVMDEVRLNSAGVSTYAQIADWDDGDAAEWAAALDLGDRIERESWIAQATLLDEEQTGLRRTGLGRPSRSFARKPGDGDSDGAPSASALDADSVDALDTRNTSTPEVAPSAVAAAVAAASAALAAASAAASPTERQVDETRDGVETEPASDEPIEWVELPNEVEMPSEHAEASPAAGMPAEITLIEPLPEPPPSVEPSVSDQQRFASRRALIEADDLKRIRGVGILIEKKLNALGITTYEQIANWTAEDVEWVSQHLAFQKRIERENWVEQARILATGGETEFSRRVDRGDV
ncbi:MAG: hypothetical protein ACFCUN_11260 [Hyphomicrobiaceae bacterium]